MEKEATDITDWASAIIRENWFLYRTLAIGNWHSHYRARHEAWTKSKIGNVEIYTDKRALTVSSLTVNGFRESQSGGRHERLQQMVNREYVFGESKYERVLNERASSGEGNKIHYGGHVSRTC